MTEIAPEGKSGKTRLVIGWTAVAITVVFTGIWSFWGVVENFHEGWYSVSVWENLFMLFVQYLLFTIVFSGLACLSLRFPKVGFAGHIILAAFAVYFFSGASFSVIYLMIAIPLVLLGLMYLFGRTCPKKLAYILIICVPLLITLIVGGVNFAKVSQRVDDGDYGLSIIEGNGITLAAAPRGPGWPENGVNYYKAQKICKYLSKDGTTIMDQEQNIWRLPAVDEAVRLMSLHGDNCGGVWDSETGKAFYEMTPDKESPLWYVHSKVIYYWTSDMPDEEHAYMIVYHGGVFKRRADASYAYLGFRAVKDVE